MPRTLRRDSKELYGLRPFRSRTGRESSSSRTADDGSADNGSESNPRGVGTFTLHGKKASVITLSPEWQQMSAEERLRHRKGEGSEDVRLPHLEVPNRSLNGHDTTIPHSSTASEDNRTSYHSVLEDASSFGSVLKHLDYALPQPQQTTEIDPATMLPEATDPRNTGTNIGGQWFGEAHRGDDLESAPMQQTQSRFSTQTFYEDSSSPDDETETSFKQQVGMAIGGYERARESKPHPYNDAGRGPL